MTDSSKAIFLSYASEDLAAAAQICASLRAAGIEVWFDQSELRGGDAWDHKIREKVRDCVLFIPIISANTQARPEGYFRLEWDVADQRSHMIGRSKAFIVPVCIDKTADRGADVPDSFLKVQWTKLPGGETPESFCERIAVLLGDGRGAGQPQLGGKPAPAVVPKRASHRWKILTALGALVLLWGGWQSWRLMTPKRSGAALQPGATAATVTPEKSIAVLPFVNMSSDKDQEYFSDGLSEEMIDLLSQVPGLRVPARTSSFYFKGKSQDISSIAQQLRVAHVLEGSVRKSGIRIRVTAQLIRADNGYHLWSKTYDRDVKDIFKVQDEIAAAVVEALKAKLLPAQALASRHRTANTEAYTQYLLGTQFRLRDTRDANRQALSAFQKAVALDPAYAAAYSGLSEAEWRIADQTTGEAAGYQRAALAADKAIALAPDSPEGYWARGQLHNSHFFDWTGALADYKKALALDSNHTPALIDESMLLATLGRMPEGIATLRKAIALDPMSVLAWRHLARLLMHSGQLPAAREAIDRLLAIDPQGDVSASRAGDLELLAGRPNQALARLQNVGTDFRLIGAAMAEHSLGQAAESQRMLDLLIKTDAAAWAYQIAEVYAWRGEKRQAFEWLERAYRQLDGGLTYLTYDRFLANLRGDPRLQALQRKLRLPET